MATIVCSVIDYMLIATATFVHLLGMGNVAAIVYLAATVVSLIIIFVKNDIESELNFSLTLFDLVMAVIVFLSNIINFSTNAGIVSIAYIILSALKMLSRTSNTNGQCNLC